MLYLVLGICFVAVFVFIGWRIMSTQAPAPSRQETYVCPRCSEQHCDCIKTSAAADSNSSKQGDKR